MAEQQKTEIKFPERLISSVDLARVTRELQALDDSLYQAELRKPGEPTKLARTSNTLEELARVNTISLIDKASREELIAMLKAFYAHAPRIHVSLATEPSAAAVRKIVFWMRQNINPVILVEIGLQPTLAAGCQVRTANKVFDMSLRDRFTENRHMLVEKMRGAAQEAPADESVLPEAPAISTTETAQ